MERDCTVLQANHVRFRRLEDRAEAMEHGQRQIADAISGIAHQFAQMRERTDNERAISAINALSPKPRTRDRRSRRLTKTSTLASKSFD